jgi:hypothetical protein
MLTYEFKFVGAGVKVSITETIFEGGKTTKKVWLSRHGIEGTDEETIYDPPTGGGAYLQRERLYMFGGFKFKEVDRYDPNPR